MLREYTYQNYKADLDSLIKDMHANEEEAKQNTNKNIDDVTFLKDMQTLHKLSKEWINLIKADSTYTFIVAGRALLKVYKETHFSTHSYYPGVVGPRSLELAQRYLKLMKSAQDIAVPKVGSVLTQPAINLAAASEKKDALGHMKELELLIHRHLNPNATVNFRKK